MDAKKLSVIGSGSERLLSSASEADISYLKHITEKLMQEFLSGLHLMKWHIYKKASKVKPKF